MKQNSTRRDIVELSQLEAYSLAKTKLTEMYNTEVGRKFIHHLVFSFIVDKTLVVLFSNKPMFDCITKGKINPLYESNRYVTDPEVIELLKKISHDTEQSIKDEVLSEINDIIIKKFAEVGMPSRMAVRSRLSDKLLGIEELQALLDLTKQWVEDESSTIHSMICGGHKRKKKRYRKQSPKKVDSRSTLAANDEIASKLKSIKF